MIWQELTWRRVVCVVAPRWSPRCWPMEWACPRRLELPGRRASHPTRSSRPTVIQLLCPSRGSLTSGCCSGRPASHRGVRPPATQHSLTTCQWFPRPPSTQGSIPASAPKVEKLKFVLFNDATGTHWFLSYHRLLDVIHMVTLTHFLEGNPLPPHRLLFSISSKGSFICTFP